MSDCQKPLRELSLNPVVQGNEGPVIQALLTSTHYGILMTDLQGTDILCNSRFGELFGVDTEVVVHSTREEVRRMALERVKDPTGFNRIIERVYTDPSVELEDEVELSTDPPRFLRRFTGPVRDEAGAILGRVWTFDDITEMRRLQAEVAAQEILIQGAKLSAVGTLAASIAHDIRNILTPLKLELALAGPDSCPAAATAHVDRLAALAHRLLALTQEPGREHAAVDLPRVMEEIQPLLQHQADVDGVTILVDWPEVFPPVMGDRKRLEHLFINLMLNGLNAMSMRGGTLSLSGAVEGDEVRVDVADEGGGIEAEHLDRIFDPFFTTRKNGTGLGLFSVRRIAEEHGGRITVISRLGEGSCFSVYLPVREAQDSVR